MSGWRQRGSLWRPDVYMDDFAPDLAMTPCAYRRYTDLQWNCSFPEMPSFQNCSDVTETRYLTQDKFARWFWHFGPRNMPSFIQFNITRATNLKCRCAQGDGLTKRTRSASDDGAGPLERDTFTSWEIGYVICLYHASIRKIIYYNHGWMFPWCFCDVSAMLGETVRQ